MIRSAKKKFFEEWNKEMMKRQIFDLDLGNDSFQGPQLILFSKSFSSWLFHLMKNTTKRHNSIDV